MIVQPMTGEEYVRLPPEEKTVVGDLVVWFTGGMGPHTLPMWNRRVWFKQWKYSRWERRTQFSVEYKDIPNWRITPTEIVVELEEETVNISREHVEQYNRKWKKEEEQ